MRTMLRPVGGPQTPHPLRVDPAQVYGAAFLCASFAFCLKSLLAAELGAATSFVAIIGNATCGWSWLATRSLFRNDIERHNIWPTMAVLLLMLLSAIASMELVDGTPLRMLDNLTRLGSSAMLLLAVVEPFLRLSEQRDKKNAGFVSHM